MSYTERDNEKERGGETGKVKVKKRKGERQGERESEEEKGSFTVEYKVRKREEMKEKGGKRQRMEREKKRRW